MVLRERIRRVARQAGIGRAGIFTLGIATELDEKAVRIARVAVTRLRDVVDGPAALVVRGEAALIRGHVQRVVHARPRLIGAGVLKCIGLAVGVRIDRDRLAGFGAACPVIILNGCGFGVVVRRILFVNECPRTLRERGVVVDLAVIALEHKRAADPAARRSGPFVDRLVFVIGSDGGKVALRAVVLVGLGLVVGLGPRELFGNVHVVVVAEF